MPNLKNNKVIKMSNWIFTQKGALLKSEIYILYPQYVESTQKFQVVAVLKTNNTSAVMFENLASYDLAMVVIDKILTELDATYKPVIGQPETPPQKETEEIPPEEVKKVKKAKSDVE